jgi:predicted DNA-binding transcriptional regulator YafY
MAVEFNVSQRQILRDITSLSTAGFPLEAVHEYPGVIWRLIKT